MSEIEILKKALGLELENNGLDWAKFKVAHGLQPQDAKTEAADRAWFTWQHFRGEHRPNSCLLDDEGRVIGLIVKGTSLRELKLPSLPALSYLCICDNKDLGKVEFAGEYPVLQHIDLGGNGLPRLSFKASFPALKYLNISKNSIADFKLESSLPSLIELDLSDNQIKNWLPFLIDKLPLAEYLFLNGNPLNESVTVYRVEGEDQNYLPCLKKLRSAFSAGAPVKNDEFKVLVIGDGKAGKSCMVHRLVEDKFLETWDSTHGISVKRFEPGSDTRFNGFPYKLNLWDFGGQDIYHHTHRMFLQSNTTYILLWNEDTEFKDSITQQTRRHSYKWQNKKLVYWLDYVRYLGQNSPVVVAKTKSSPLYNPVGHPDENKIRERYRQPELPYLSNFLHLDSKAEDLDENGYNDLIEGIKAAIKSLKRDELLPAHWVFIREQLEAMKVSETADSTRAFLEEENEVLDYDTYYHLAKDAGEQDPDKLLNNWLVQTGVVFYKKGLFDDKIILNQSWAIRAVYALYDRSEEGYYTDIKEEKGNFDGALLNNCWADYKPQEREWFLQFMLKAELCVEITTEKEASWDQRQFLALEMLPEKRTSGIVIQEENWQEQKTPLARLRYHYPFLHLGLIQSFIVRTYRYAEVKDIYKDGLLINVDGKKVIVEVKKEPGAKGGHCGHILVSAPASQVAILRSIQKEFESIHADHKVEQQICVGDSPWIKWDTLVARPGEEYLVSIDEAAVPAAPYRIFLADKEQPVDSLSETLIRSTTVKIPTTNIDNMTPEEIKKLVQDHIGSARTGEAIKAFKQWAQARQQSTLLNSLLMVESDWNKLKSEKMGGIISWSDENLRNGQITHRLLSLVGEIEVAGVVLPQEISDSRIVLPPPPPPTIPRPGPAKIFLSYAHELFNEAERLKTHLAVQKRNGKIEFWHDQAIRPGENWDETIKEKIGEADIFILLLNPDFWASDYIQTEELPLIERRKGEGAKVFCVMVSDNDFEDTAWSKLQAGPQHEGRLKPIELWDNQNTAWKSVVDDLKRLL